jgi:signal transduction histidine kinase
MMNTDGIIIHDGEIVLPIMHIVNDEIYAEINHLFRYFLTHRTAFYDENLQRVLSARGVYYLKAVDIVSHYSPIGGDHTEFTILLYTDITSAMLFMHQINRTLVFLLIVSGLLSAFSAVLLSAKVERSIARLRKHAVVIGHGNFAQKAEDFNFTEFNALAQSMNTMADMLHTYEKNQKQFFQNFSHKLSTPLMSIQGYTEAILGDVMDKRDAAEIILSESERMENLVSQILYVSRLDSGLDALNITTFSVNDMLCECAEHVKMLAAKSGKELVLEILTDIKIRSDEEKLQRIAENLLSNCIRHANAQVTASFTADENAFTLTISDDGEGFITDELPHIFKRFYKGAKGNSGLGLAICKDIAEKLGGDILAENIPHNKGARFVVRIPLTP